LRGILERHSVILRACSRRLRYSAPRNFDHPKKDRFPINIRQYQEFSDTKEGDLRGISGAPVFSRAWARFPPAIFVFLTSIRNWRYSHFRMGVVGSAFNGREGRVTQKNNSYPQQFVSPVLYRVYNHCWD
jgi:hypothetical protein